MQRSRRVRKGKPREAKPGTGNNQARPGISSRGSSTTVSTVTLEKLQGLAVQVFHNHVIVEKVMPYLDFSSIKAFSSVNQRLKSIIRANTGFLKHAKVRFGKQGTGKPLLGANPKLLKPDDFPWKTVCFDVSSGWKKDLAAVLRLIPNITSLEVHRDANAIHSEQEADVLAAVLRSCLNLRELSVDADVLDVEPASFLSVVLEDPVVQGNVKQLESLWFKQPTGSLDAYCVANGERFGFLIQRFGEIPYTLTRFGFEGISTSYVMPGTILHLNVNDFVEITKGILSTLERHKTTLTTIVLDAHLWVPNSFLPSAIFENLKELGIAASSRLDLPVIARFLKNQPPLTKLLLTFDGDITSTYCKDLESAVLRHASTLKQFSLTWRVEGPLEILPVPFLQVFRIPPDDADWDAPNPPQDGNYDDNEVNVAEIGAEGGEEIPEMRDDDAAQEPMLNPNGGIHVLPVVASAFSFAWLSQIGCLKQVQIRQLGDSQCRNSLYNIITDLPTGIRDIEVTGTPMPATLGSGLGVQHNGITEILDRFQNLTVLNLIQCPDVIDDNVMKFICRRLNKLLEFGFSHCSNLTDFGITAEVWDEGMPQHGLGALTGLRKLQIMDCEKLSRKGYLGSVAFTGLRELTLLTAYGRMEHTFYVELVRQNRSLEVLAICKDEFYKFQKLRKTLKRHSQRFREVIFIPWRTCDVDPTSEDEDDGDSHFSFESYMQEDFDHYDSDYDCYNYYSSDDSD